MFVSKTQNPDDSAVVGQVEPILAPGKDGTAKKTMALPEALGVTSENKEAAQKNLLNGIHLLICRKN